MFWSYETATKNCLVAAATLISCLLFFRVKNVYVCIQFQKVRYILKTHSLATKNTTATIKSSNKCCIENDSQINLSGKIWLYSGYILAK